MLYTVKDLKHVLVFKTNISHHDEKQKVGELLALQSHIEDWSVDLEDVDRVLRVVSKELCPEKIIGTICDLGFTCSELE